LYYKSYLREKHLTHGSEKDIYGTYIPENVNKSSLNSQYNKTILMNIDMVSSLKYLNLAQQTTFLAYYRC